MSAQVVSECVSDVENLFEVYRRLEMPWGVSEAWASALEDRAWIETAMLTPDDPHRALRALSDLRGITTASTTAPDAQEAGESPYP